MRRARSTLHAARRILLFTGVPALGAFSPLIVLPALTHVLGADGWASLAVAQAAGAFGALIANWAWNVEGPALASAAAPERRADLYAASMRTRTVGALVGLPLAAGVAFLVAPEFAASAALMAAAVSLSGLLPSWYFIGRGAPVRLALFDAIPRILTAVVSAVLLVAIPSDWVYPVVLAGATLAAVVIGSRVISGRWIHLPTRTDLLTVRARILLVSSGLISGGYTTLTIPVVAVVAPGAVPVFAAASRFQGYGTLGLSAVTNAAQGWVSAHGIDSETLTRRRRSALIGNSIAGVAAGGVLYVGLPAASTVLFSGTVLVQSSTALLVAAIIVMLAISMSTTFHLLVPTGRTRVVALSGIATSVVGVPLLLALTAARGADGALTAVLIAETMSAAVQLVAYFGPARARRRLTRRRRASAEPAPAPAISSTG